MLNIFFLLTKCKDPYAKEVSKILFENEGHVSKRKVPIETALAVYTDCSMGRLTYSNECKILQSAGFNILPPWCRLKEEQTAITPSTLDLPQPHVGVYIPFYNAIKVTAKQIFENLSTNNVVIKTNSLHMNIKYGFDGSGSHAIFNQINNVETNNIILNMFCALDITENESVVWKETSPNHPLTHRPLMLQMGK